MRTFIGNMPARIARLPRDRRGFPVPKFVHWENGEPIFPVMETSHFVACVKRRLCWICGDVMGAHKTFVIGPMCCINRISSEPPSHYDCARFAALNCPFLAQPLAKRTVEAGDYGTVAPRGIMIERNPGVSALWTTRGYRITSERLVALDAPESVEFYAKGRRATRFEVVESVDSGLPLLRAAAERDGPEGVRAFNRAVATFMAMLDRMSWNDEARAIA